VELEQSGLTRAAVAAFHEAATLYQCFLDYEEQDREHFGHTFRHVTGFGSAEACRNVLAYTCVRLAHLNHDALGDSRAASRLYRDAATIDTRPSSVAYNGMGTSTEAYSAGSLLDTVISHYRMAHDLDKNNAMVKFHLAVALERNSPDEESEESQALLDELRSSGRAQDSCLVDSWGYVRWHMRRIPQADFNLHRGTRDMLKIGLDAAMDLIINENGFVAEFGVGSGRSLRMLQELLPLDYNNLHAFDTFTGLPTAWGEEPAGAYSTGGILPFMNNNKGVSFHSGLFGDTIPQFVSSLSDQPYQPLAFANIDCDLYQSTLDILESLHGRIVPGTVLVFDEYLCHSSWRQDEFRAWRECCKRFGWQYEYLAFSLGTKQAIVRVLDA
jgi:hypothetical protein